MYAQTFSRVSKSRGGWSSRPVSQLLDLTNSCFCTNITVLDSYNVFPFCYTNKNKSKPQRRRFVWFVWFAQNIFHHPDQATAHHKDEIPIYLLSQMGKKGGRKENAFGFSILNLKQMAEMCHSIQPYSHEHHVF